LEQDGGYQDELLRIIVLLIYVTRYSMAKKRFLLTRKAGETFKGCPPSHNNTDVSQVKNGVLYGTQWKRCNRKIFKHPPIPVETIKSSPAESWSSFYLST